MPTWPPLHLIGVTHRDADVRLRERLARTPLDLATRLRRPPGAAVGGVVLSTCNRFEVYWWGEASWDGWSHDGDAWHEARTRGALLRRDAEAAIRHLFTVTAGLDAQVIGETEVLGQVRRAWLHARETGTSCREIDTTFAAALSAARRVHHETELGRRPPSVGAVAVAAAAGRVGGGLAGRIVVVIGAGQAARGVAAALDGRSARVHLVSRNADRAGLLARDYGLIPEPWESLDGLLAAADVVFAATAAPRSIMSVDRLAAARAGSEAAVVLVDLGVPRNVDPAARTLPGVAVFDLDDLRSQGDVGFEPAAGVAAALGVLEREAARLVGKLRRAGPFSAEESLPVRVGRAG